VLDGRAPSGGEPPLASVDGPWSPRAVRRIFWLTLVYFSIGAVALVAIVGATIWLGVRSQVYFDEVTRDHDIRAAAIELRVALETGESSQRGYLLSNNEIYLSPYDAAKLDAQRQVASLKQLLGSDVNFATPIARLESDASQKLDEMDETITLQRTGHGSEALALVTTNKGKELMDEANVFVTGIIQFSDEALAATVTEQRGNAEALRWVSVIGGLVIVAVVCGALYGMVRYTRDLRAARDELDTLNDQLEQRVTERTADLSDARARAEMLLSEVNHRVANSLALVSSLVSLQAKSLADPSARIVLTEAQDRIFAISLVHRSLYSSDDVRVVALGEYLRGLLDHLAASLQSGAQGGVVLTHDLEAVTGATDVAINLGVIVTEWVTNAFKYAYPNGLGEVRVRLRALENERAELVVEDDGIGRTEGERPRGSGVGTRIVTSVAASLNGAITYEPRTPGTAAKLAFSLRGKTGARLT
jgi:two-component sensor histidine kinase/CHASE3 domain sensor protein